MKKLFIFVLGGLILVASIIAGLFVFALWGGGGEPATFGVALRVDQEFVEAIHNRQIDVAYGMLSEKFPPVTKEEFASFIMRDERIFKTYRYLDVCDWGFFISDGRVITSSGLLYYENGVIVVEISLHKDSDSIWRVQGFRFRPDVSPQPFGMCK